MSRALSHLTLPSLDQSHKLLVTTCVDFGEDAGACEEAAHRSVTVGVTGGLDGVVRIAMMLRGRRYEVHAFAAQIDDDVLGSEVRFIVVLTGQEMSLLLDRLRREPSVISADQTG